MRNRRSNTLLDITANYIIKLLVNELPHQHLYHGIHHTFEVVNYSKLIGQNSGIEGEQLEDLLLSAWFHDVGFVETYKGHEERSVIAAESFLSNFNIGANRINRICKCILATEFVREPSGLIEEVICDADMAHVGQGTYIVKQELLRMELESITHHVFDDLDWAEENFKFLTKHKFYTEYANRKYTEMKKQNLNEVIERLEFLRQEKEINS